MAQSRAEIVARWRAKRDPRNQWLFIVERHLGIPRKKKYQHIGVVEWRMKHKRGPKPRAPIPIDRATALRCVLSPLRLKRWHAAEKVRMYEANPKRGLKISLDEKGS